MGIKPDATSTSCVTCQRERSGVRGAGGADICGPDWKDEIINTNMLETTQSCLTYDFPVNFQHHPQKNSINIPISQMGETRLKV